MDRLRNYDVVFSGLKNGKHQFTFEIGQAFFQLFDTELEFDNPKLNAEILLDKHSTFLEFWIRTTGTIGLSCDITGKPFDNPVDHEIKVLVKFGEEYDDSDEDVITIPEHDHAFNVAQLIYEDVMLSVPMKKISPEVSEKDLEILERFSPKTEPEEESTEDTDSDPRWDTLKQLKDKNKK